MKICVATMVGPDDDAHEAWLSALPLLDDEQFMDVTPGKITDFASARNDLLARCAEEGYDWAMVLDCDERIIDVVPEHFRQMVEESGADVIMVKHVSDTYEKERIFRLPAKGHFHGRTHEAFIMDEGAIRKTIGGVRFDEIAKSPEEYRAKVERDLPLLEQMTQEDPMDPRWWYYLGDSRSGLGDRGPAITAFHTCWMLDGWDEESAWAAYRIAELYVADARYDDSIDWCCAGLQRHPGMAELPWLAGWCCYQLGHYQKAIWWETMAATLATVGAHKHRIGFRYPPALAEGPFDVIHWAEHALGHEENARVAEMVFQQRLAERESAQKIARS